MKKLKALSLILLFALVVTIIQPATVSAAVKINKSEATIYIGNTITLKISGTTKTVKWSTSDKKVATVTSSGKVTAKAVGTATITAKVNSKKYTCEITVKENFDSLAVLKSLKCKYYEYSDGIIAIITNNYSYDIEIDATAVFYGNNDKMIDKSTDNNYCLGVGKTCALRFHAPYDSNYNNVNYAYYKINYSCQKSYYKDLSSTIKLTYNDGADNVMVEAKNSGGKEFDSAIISIVFFKNGKVVGYDYSYLNCNSSGSVDYKDFSYPYDDNYDTIMPDDYVIFINSCYHFGW